MSRDAHPCGVLRGHASDVQALIFQCDHHGATHLLSGDAQGEVRVWDLGTLRPVAARRLHPADSGVISLAAWRPAPAVPPLLVTQGRDGVTHLWQLDEELKLPEGPPLRTFAREAYSFCRASLLAVDNLPDPVPAHLDERQAFAEAALGGAPPPATAPPSPSPAAAQAAIDAVHACPSSLPAALLAIPGHSEKEAEVCCACCGAAVAAFRQDHSAAEGDRWGMVMAVKLFLGPQNRVMLAGGFESGHVVIWDVGAAAAAAGTGGPAAAAAGTGGPAAAAPPTPLAVGKLHSEPVMALDIDAGGLAGVSGSAEDKLAAFGIDYGGGAVAAAAAVDVRKQGVADVALRQDGKLLASAGWDGKVRVYKRSNGKALAVLKYHAQAASAVAFCPETFLLASGARDGTVALWDVYAKPGAK